jgi:hypothetical protein
MTGEALLASFGSAIPGAIELYVHQRDFEKARAAIEQYERERAEREAGGQEHSHPEDEPAPHGERHHQKRHIPPHPAGQ